MTPLLVLISMLGDAAAGDDPWLAPKNTTNIYVATVGERFANFVGPNSTRMPVDGPIYSMGGKVYVRHGLGQNMDISLDIPVSRVWSAGANQDGLYAPTLGVGLLQGEARYRILSRDAPLGLSTRLVVRSGTLHRDSRGRLTNLGEGSTDIGAGVGLGKLSLLGSSFLTMDAGATYWYRFPLEDGNVPADEVSWSSNLVFTSSSRFGLGLTSTGLHRLGGQDLGAVNVQDQDNKWAALQAQQIKAGGRISIYSAQNLPSISISVLRAVWARNNPIDTTLLEIGIGWDIRRED